MVTVFLYIVSASTACDSVTCSVPWLVDENLIFFGPCKKPLRRKLLETHVPVRSIDSRPVSVEAKDLHVIGLSGASAGCRPRHVLWAGQIITLYNFKTAYETFHGDARFSAMLADPFSPLHVEPLPERSGIGYKIRSRLHFNPDAAPAENPWVWDLVDKNRKKTALPAIQVNKDSIRLKKPSDYSSKLSLDCCFTCSPSYFARGTRLPLDDEFVRLLQEAQPAKADGIDAWCVFGTDKRGIAYGRLPFLEVEGPLAKRMLEWINPRVEHSLPLKKSTRVSKSSGCCK